MGGGISAMQAKGKYFGRLFVVNIFYKEKQTDQAWAKCRCACDKQLPKEDRKIVYIRLATLRNGRTRSCGCLKSERAKTGIHRSHGESVGGKRSTEYLVHRNMLRRCYDLKSQDYNDYGGRGIQVYKPWHNFPIFLEYILKHLGRRPSKKYSLDRIDNDKNYEPGNIKWSTATEQANNRRSVLNRKDSLVVLRLIRHFSKLRILTAEETTLALKLISTHQFKRKYIYTYA